MTWELLLGVGRFVLATTLLLLLTVPTAFVIIQMELKVIAGMNLRLGPNRIGPSGMFQSTIHGFKVLAKEDTVPDQADRGTFTLAPWMVYMAAAMSMLVIPFAPGAIASQHEHRHRLLLRGARALGGRPAGRRLGELQQVLAARRAAQRRPDGELRDPADPLDRRRRRAGRHAQLQRADRLAARERLALRLRSRSASPSSTSPRWPR